MLSFDHCRRLTYLGLLPFSFCLLRLPLKDAMLAACIVLLTLGVIGLVIRSAGICRILSRD